MFDWIVEIEWPTGIEIYSFLSVSLTSQQGQSLPLLLKPPQISRALSIDTMENGNAIIELNDSTNHFTQKLNGDDKYIVGKTLTIKDSSGTIFVGAVADFPDTEPGSHSFKIKADIFSMLKQKVNKVITDNDFENCPSQNLGKPGNVIYGYADAVAGEMFYAHRVDQNLFLAAWNSIIIDEVHDRQGNVLSVTTQTLNGWTLISVANSDDYLLFSCTGPQNGGTVIDNPAEMLQGVLTLFCNGPVATIENYTEAFNLFETRNHLGNMLFVKERQSLKGLLIDFGQSFNVKPFVSRTGKISLKFLKFTFPTTENIFPSNEIAKFKKKRITRHLFGDYQRNYQYRPSQGRYGRSPVDVIQRTGFSEESSEFRQKFAVTDSTSRDVAFREAYLREKPILHYKYTVPFYHIDSLELGDELQIRHYKGYYEEYRWTVIFKIEVQGIGGVQVEGLDLSEIQRATTFVLLNPGEGGTILREPGHPENPIIFFSE